MIIQTFTCPYFDLSTISYYTDVIIQTPFIICLEIFIISSVAGVIVLFSSKSKIAKEALDATTKIVAIVAGSTMVYKNTKSDSGGSGSSDSDKDKDKDNGKDKKNEKPNEETKNN